MDTGRIRMENYRGILYCEAYMRDEFSLSDLESMRAKIREDYAPTTDVILKKSDSYSVSLEAQLILQKGVEEFRDFVYVVDDNKKKDSAEYAAASYDCVAIFRETRRDIQVPLGSEKLATGMPSAGPSRPASVTTRHTAARHDSHK